MNTTIVLLGLVTLFLVLFFKFNSTRKTQALSHSKKLCYADNHYYQSNEQNHNAYDSKEAFLGLAYHSNYEKQKILNSNEYIVFNIVNDLLGHKYHLFPQVSLGETLKSEDGYNDINSKRAGMLIVDKITCCAIAAIEYSSSPEVYGYYQGDAVECYVTKCIALTKAGIKYIVLDSTNEVDIRRRLEKEHLDLSPTSHSMCYYSCYKTLLQNPRNKHE